MLAKFGGGIGTGQALHMMMHGQRCMLSRVFWLLGCYARLVEASSWF